HELPVTLVTPEVPVVDRAVLRLEASETDGGPLPQHYPSDRHRQHQHDAERHPEWGPEAEAEPDQMSERRFGGEEAVAGSEEQAHRPDVAPVLEPQPLGKDPGLFQRVEAMIARDRARDRKGR